MAVIVLALAEYVTVGLKTSDVTNERSETNADASSAMSWAIEQFAKKPQLSSGYASWCRPCRAENLRAWRAETARSHGGLGRGGTHPLDKLTRDIVCTLGHRLAPVDARAPAIPEGLIGQPRASDALPGTQPGVSRAYDP